MREAGRHAEQVFRPGAREGVDRLIVVADDADLVAAAEPELEQALLQKVHVLVLVDRECAVLRAEGGRGSVVALEQAHRALQQILEIDQALGLLAPLVVAVDARHQVDGDRRLAVGCGRGIAAGVDAAVLRPLDLGGEVARRPELVGTRQPVADLTK